MVSVATFPPNHLDPAGAIRPRTQAPVIKEDPTVDESNLTFWPYTLAGFGMAMPSTAMMFHNYNILGQSGIGHAASTAAFGTLGIVAAVSNLVAGRFSIRSLTVYRSAPILIGGSTTGIGGVILHGINLCGMLGSWTPISASFDAKHFGRRHLGRGRHGRRDRVGARSAPILPRL